MSQPSTMCMQIGGIPLPKALAFDGTLDNKLGDPYMIHTGFLEQIYYLFSPNQSRAEQSSEVHITTDLSRIFRRILPVESISAGVCTLIPKVCSYIMRVLDYSKSHLS